MLNFEYHCPTKIIFGHCTELKAGEETAKYSKKILFLYGKNSIKESGLYCRIVESLKKNNVEFVELSGVVPNPRIELVQQGIELCRKEKLDFILAVGGGSVIDSAKAIAAGACYDGNVWDFFTEKAVAKKALPVGVILTIPAAGSETSKATVITNKKRKRPYSSQLLRPVFALLNPELTFSLPDYQTVCGVADMLSHVMERYFSNTEQVDLTDKLCEATMKTIMQNAPLVLKEPKNYDYRAEIMLAGTIAHNGILGLGREEDWASHNIEHELSATYDIAHGAGLAIIFPAWLKFVSKKNPEKLLQFARNVMEIKTIDEKKAIAQAIEALELFYKKIGLAIRLSELKIDDSKFEEMAKQCLNGEKTIGNFVKLSEKDILEIYEIALKYNSEHSQVI